MRKGQKYCVILAILLAISSCCPCKHLPHPGAQVKDSLAVHVKDSIAIHLIGVSFPIPGESIRETVSVKDTSRLETSVASSIAYIDKDGRLHHELTNKPGSISTEVPVEEHFHSADSSHFHSEVKPEIVEVEKPLKWWQKFRINAFWWLVLIDIALLAWIFRKRIIKLLS